MSDVLGVGILGCGNISAAYLRLGPLFNGLEIRAVADILPEAAASRAEEFNVAAQTPDELIGNSELDVIVNLTIPDVHYKLTKEIVSAGKHAYSEKPFVLDLEEGKELRALAETNNVRIGSAPDTFLGGTHQYARKLIDEGAIGRIASGTCHMLARGAEHWHPNPSFFYQPGAGPVLDMGPYYITNLVNLVGPVNRVTALSGTARKQREIISEPLAGQMIEVNTPTTIHAVLEFENGAIITVGMSWDVQMHGHSNMELYGLDGTMFVPDPNFFGGELAIGRAGGERENVEIWDHPFGVPNQERPDGTKLANYRTAGLADMVVAIAQGRDARCGLDRALHVVDVMTSILKSGETGQVVEMTTTCTQPAPLGPEEAASLLKS